jgi:nicotinamidase-related amidase
LDRKVTIVKTVAGKRYLTTLEEIVSPERAALIVVDLQNDFCSVGGAWNSRGYDVGAMPDVIANSKRLIDGAREAGVPVIYIQMSKLPNLMSLSPSYFRFMIDKNDLDVESLGCEPDTWGIEIVPEVAPQPGELVIPKWRSSAFVGTPLELVLRSNGIESVIVCGVATHACVESTVRDAFNNDFYVALVEDCVGAFDQHLHDAAMTVLRGRVDVVTCDQVREAWSNLRKDPALATSAAQVPAD